MKKFMVAILLTMVPAVLLAEPLWSEEGNGVALNQAVLDNVLAKNISQFTLPVDGNEYRVIVENVSQPNLGVTSLNGRIDGNPESFFLLCRTNSGATIAFFQPGDGSAYRLDHSKGRDAVYPIEYEKLGPCGGAVKLETIEDGRKTDDPHSAPLIPNFDKSRSVADDGSRHDILIGYTPAAEAVMGGWDYIRAEAQLAVDAANWTYVNSNIASYLRLSHVMATDYEENSAWEYTGHWFFLYYPDDGHMDDMLTMRETVGADFVSVLIDGRNFDGEVPTCGIAAVMQPDEINMGFEYKALSIVSVQCATDNWTLAHEVGHNRGCAHNRVNATIDGAYTYAYGLRFYYNPDTDFGLRTVMAYDHIDGGYTRVPHFSNPDVNYAGHPTGIEVGLFHESHNALVHDNTASVCATFRGERTFVKFSYDWEYSDGMILFPYRTIAEAVEGSRDGGNIVVQESKPDYTGILSEPRQYISDADGGIILGGN